MSVKIAIDLKVFEIIAEKPHTLAELAEKTKANPMLLKRILRLITAIGYLKQEEVDKWEATPLTFAATVPPLKNWMIAHFNKRMDTYAQFPDWLKRHEYKASWFDDDNV